jgi:hypothetical protein
MIACSIPTTRRDATCRLVPAAQLLKVTLGTGNHGLNRLLVRDCPTFGLAGQSRSHIMSMALRARSTVARIMDRPARRGPGGRVLALR